MRSLLIVAGFLVALWSALDFAVALDFVGRAADAWPGYATICVPGPRGTASIEPAPGVVGRLDVVTELECPLFECEEGDRLEPVVRATLTIETDAGRESEQVGVTAGSHCATFAVPRSR